MQKRIAIHPENSWKISSKHVIKPFMTELFQAFHSIELWRSESMKATNSIVERDLFTVAEIRVGGVLWAGLPTVPQPLILPSGLQYTTECRSVDTVTTAVQ